MPQTNGHLFFSGGRRASRYHNMVSFENGKFVLRRRGAEDGRSRRTKLLLLPTRPRSIFVVVALSLSSFAFYHHGRLRMMRTATATMRGASSSSSSSSSSSGGPSNRDDDDYEYYDPAAVALRAAARRAGLPGGGGRGDLRRPAHQGGRRRGEGPQPGLNSAASGERVLVDDAVLHDDRQAPLRIGEK